MNRALIVFAKEPVNGTVKTRLKSCFSEEDRTRLYKAFLKDTIAIAQAVNDARKILAFASQGVPRFLKRVGIDFEMIEQEGRGLGERMYNAFCYANEKKLFKTVIIGTDAPTLPAQIIEKAFCALNHNDLVIGPSADGGYYLIGMKEPRKEIFKGVRWSTASVLNKTIANAESEGLTIALVDEWYDVDDRKGLERLRKDLAMLKDKNTAVNTHRYFEGRK